MPPRRAAKSRKAPKSLKAPKSRSRSKKVIEDSSSVALPNALRANDSVYLLLATGEKVATGVIFAYPDGNLPSKLHGHELSALQAQGGDGNAQYIVVRINSVEKAHEDADYPYCMKGTEVPKKLKDMFCFNNYVWDAFRLQQCSETSCSTPAAVFPKSKVLSKPKRPSTSNTKEKKRKTVTSKSNTHSVLHNATNAPITTNANTINAPKSYSDAPAVAMPDCLPAPSPLPVPGPVTAPTADDPNAPGTGTTTTADDPNAPGPCTVPTADDPNAPGPGTAPTVDDPNPPTDVDPAPATTDYPNLLTDVDPTPTTTAATQPKATPHGAAKIMCSFPSQNQERISSTSVIGSDPNTDCFDPELDKAGRSGLEPTSNETMKTTAPMFKQSQIPSMSALPNTSIEHEKESLDNTDVESDGNLTDEEEEHLPSTVTDEQLLEEGAEEDSEDVGDTIDVPDTQGQDTYIKKCISVRIDQLVHHKNLARTLDMEHVGTLKTSLRKGCSATHYCVSVLNFTLFS